MYGFSLDEQAKIAQSLNISIQAWQELMTARHEQLKQKGQTSLFDLPIEQWYSKARFQARMNSGLSDIDTPERVLKSTGFNDVEIDIIKSKQLTNIF